MLTRAPPHSPDTQLSWCATPDIGGVAAAVIKAGPGEWGGKTVGVAGEHATAQQVAATYSRVFGKEVGTSARLAAGAQCALCWQRRRVCLAVACVALLRAACSAAATRP